MICFLWMVKKVQPPHLLAKVVMGVEEEGRETEKRQEREGMIKWK